MSGYDPELRATETFQFRGRLAEAAQQPEFMRADSMIVFLRQIRCSPYLTQDECFEAVYGAYGARKFWEVLCSEPIELRLFVNLLAVTGATLEVTVYNVNLWAAMLGAYQAGERMWFVGDMTPFEGANYGWQVAGAKGQDKLKVRARDAAEWLLRMPMRRHLVPEWVATVLRPAPPLGPEAAKARPSQSEINTWMLAYYQEARTNGVPPPKRAEQAFPECVNALGATVRQMGEAMRTVPSDLKRTRGGRDRK